MPFGSSRASIVQSQHSQDGHGRRLWTLFIALLFLAAPFLIFAGPAASDPIVVDNPDDTGYLMWDFTSTENYTMTDTVLDGGFGMLKRANESFVQNSSLDFSTGDMSNIDTTTWPGYMALDSAENSYTVTIQPNVDTGKDTYLAEDKDDTNYGLEKEMRLDSEIGKLQHMLLRFDTSSIPSNAVVDEATMYLWQIPGGKSTPVLYTVHSLLSDFSETSATWNMNDSISDWVEPGGDYDPYPYASGTFPYAIGWFSIGISKLVAQWVKDSGDNQGIIIVPVPVGGDAVKLFQSSEQTSGPSYSPKLTVNYTIHGGMGVYESEPLGPGTNSTFTLCEWSSGMTSRLSDEFSGTALSSKWTWSNDPMDGGGTFNVGVTAPGKLHVIGESNTQNLDTSIGSNYLYQKVVGEFEATVSLSDYFTISSMGAGILLVESPMEWISVAKADPGTSGRIQVAVCTAGVSAVVKNYDWTGYSNAYLKMIRNETGLWILASHDGGSFVEVYNQTSIKTMMMSLDIGPFVYSNSASIPIVDFDYFRVVPVSYLPVEMMIRTGNSTSFTDPSWEAWGFPILGSSAILDVDSKYLQYRTYFETDYSWYTPSFDMFACHSERYLPEGYLESEDVTPSDFSMWYTLTTAEYHDSGLVKYWYSYDHGFNWIYAGTGGSYSISSTMQSLRIRVGLETYDTLSTPTVDSVTAIFGTALASMYVIAPETVVAGQSFEVMIYAKDSSNTTMLHWSGPVTLTATDRYGLESTSGALTVGTAYITNGGYVTVANERYNVAETIMIRASAQESYGYSGLVQVIPGPVATITISPDISEVLEFTSHSFSAIAYDGYGNTVSNASFTWSVDSSIGSLSSTTGSSVTFTAGEYTSIGEITVTANGVSSSKEISVIRTAHNPTFTEPIPAQNKEEDCESWELDLTPYIYDEYHLVSELRWYTTNESLITVSGENKTSNMIITFTPKADAWGVNDLVLFLVDQDGLTGSSTITVNITSVNDGPTIDDIDPLVVHYDMVYLYNLKYYIHDVDNTLDDLTVRVDYVSEAYVDVERQTLAIQYPMVLNGTIQTIFVTVTDGYLSASTTIFVSVTDDNVPISLDVLPTVELYQGESSLNLFNLDDYFIDPDDEMLYYAYGYQHVSIEINPENEVSFFAPFDWYGEEYVIFKATDPRGARVESAALV
ncbi:MAG: DNRLRE domain-containing protein, partial [Methanomassiliicoccus sp.]